MHKISSDKYQENALAIDFFAGRGRYDFKINRLFVGAILLRCNIDGLRAKGREDRRGFHEPEYLDVIV